MSGRKRVDLPGSIIVGMWNGRESASTTEDGSKISYVWEARPHTRADGTHVASGNESTPYREIAGGNLRNGEAAGRRNWPEAVPSKINGRKRLAY